MSTVRDPATAVTRTREEHLAIVGRVALQQPLLEAIAHRMTSTLLSGGKILWCSNGGSTADAEHLAVEIVGRFRRPRQRTASIALTEDSSILTAVTNDFGYEQIFARQVEALGRPGDLLVTNSTSVNSPNVVAAVEAPRALGLGMIGFTNAAVGKMAALVNQLFAVSSCETARIQEVYIFAGQMLCNWIELDAVARSAGGRL